MTVTEPNYTTMAFLSVRLFIFGMIFASKEPTGGIAMGLIGLFQGKKGLASSRIYIAWAGIIGNIILLIFSIMCLIVRFNN